MNKEPAFPVSPYKSGMTLRDYFAACSYDMADAMMKAREKNET
jgi:hypothetical protein